MIYSTYQCVCVVVHELSWDDVEEKGVVDVASSPLALCTGIVSDSSQVCVAPCEVTSGALECMKVCSADVSRGDIGSSETGLWRSIGMEFTGTGLVAAVLVKGDTVALPLLTTFVDGSLGMHEVVVAVK